MYKLPCVKILLEGINPSKASPQSILSFDNIITMHIKTARTCGEGGSFSVTVIEKVLYLVYQDCNQNLEYLYWSPSQWIFERQDQHNIECSYQNAGPER